MELWQTIIIGVAIVAVVLAVAWWVYERSRTRHLRERFGPEYDRRITALGDRRRVESELARSETRVEKVKVHPLSVSDHRRFMEEWRLCQLRFVDDPGGAVNDADQIVTNIMHTRGYAVDDPYDRVADVCAAHPRHADAFREANDIVVRHQRGNASTEDLRQAFLDFKGLFDEMLGGQDEEHKRAS
jgi:hypothetical protein